MKQASLPKGIKTPAVDVSVHCDTECWYKCCGSGRVYTRQVGFRGVGGVRECINTLALLDIARMARACAKRRITVDLHGNRTHRHTV